MAIMKMMRSRGGGRGGGVGATGKGDTGGETIEGGQEGRGVGEKGSRGEMKEKSKNASNTFLHNF